jgi:hypothetical protein
MYRRIGRVLLMYDVGEVPYGVIRIEMFGSSLLLLQ